MDTQKYRSVAVRKEIIKKVEKLAEMDIRSIPNENEVLFTIFFFLKCS